MALLLTINGKVRDLDDLDGEQTLAQVVVALGLKADRIAIELNGEIAARESWAKIRVQSGDRLELVHFVGGGTA